MEDACFVMGLRSSNLAARCYGEKQTCPWLWRKSLGGLAANRMCLPWFRPSEIQPTSFSGRPDPSGTQQTRKRWRDWWVRERKRLRRCWLLRSREGGLRQGFWAPSKCAWSPREHLSMRDYGRSVQIGFGRRSQNPTWWSCLGLSRERLKEAPCCWAAAARI